MSNGSSQIGELMRAIHSEVEAIAERNANNEDREELKTIFVDSIHHTLRDIKRGADSDTFQDLTVANFIISAGGAGYPPPAIREFVRELAAVKKARPS